MTVLQASHLLVIRDLAGYRDAPMWHLFHTPPALQGDVK